VSARSRELQPCVPSCQRDVKPHHGACLAPRPAEDERLTYGLLFEVYHLLEAHGFRGEPRPGMHEDGLVALRRLAEAYEGRPNG
jgi:hypothetical protein